MRASAAALLVALAVLLAACGYGSSASTGKPQVVAVENFWASLAFQLSGGHVQVSAIIASPDADPHDYEPTARDARRFATARYVILNGAGYDPWGDKLLSANPTSGRKVLTVASLAGRKDGDNPHLWYSPTTVLKTVDQITADLKAIDPSNAVDYDQLNAVFKSQKLAQYDQVRSQIKQQYAGTPIGSTESIFADLAADLGLNDITPPEFERAISEGTDVSPQGQTLMEQLITGRQMKVLVFNKQNSTPDVVSLVNKAKAAGIPVVAITETLDPATATFQNWQVGQLTSLQQALKQGTGR